MGKMLSFLLIFALAAGLCGGELRVVSLSPALTELVCHLGKRSALVGRSVSCDLPEEVRSLPVAGDFAKPSLEKLARLKPTLVLADSLQDVSVKQALEAMKIEIVLLPLAGFADYRQAVRTLGEKLDAKDAADAELARVDRVLRGLNEHHPAGGKRPRVLYIIWHSPLMVPGRHSFLAEFIRLAGGDHVGDCEAREYFRAAPEWVVRTAPEVVIFPGGGKAAFPPWWRELPAVKSGRVHTPPDEALFFRLSPRFDRALAELEKMIAAPPRTPETKGPAR